MCTHITARLLLQTFSWSHQSVFARERPGSIESDATATAEEALRQIRQHCQSTVATCADWVLPGLSCTHHIVVVIRMLSAPNSWTKHSTHNQIQTIQRKFYFSKFSILIVYHISHSQSSSEQNLFLCTKWCLAQANRMREVICFLCILYKFRVICT